jgi:geranylgeranyl diphosphate synthase type I
VNEIRKDIVVFTEQLMNYKEAIDKDIEAYSRHIRQSTAEQYGKYPEVVTGAYLDMLERGGKRIRGSLAMVGYAMCGGTDKAMIVRAATALELLHAYILILDDIQDRSKLRRGRPTVHEALAEYHRSHHLRGNAEHTGVALSLNAALSGAHAAQVKLKAIGIVNQTMITTAHGQTADIMNELIPVASGRDIQNALEWKTAHYTMLNPLCVGMVLAGAGCEDTDAIRDYALHTGKAFQITDDIMGIFGTDEQTGKSTMDDIREGKRTVLTSYALEHAPEVDRITLERSLGNEALSKEEFQACQRILRDSGALDNALKEAQEHVDSAMQALVARQPHWKPQGVAFLRGLAQSLLSRTA